METRQLSWTNTQGAALETPRTGAPIQPDRMRDTILIGLRAQQMSWREIASIMKISHVHAQRIYRAIPEATRRALCR